MSMFMDPDLVHEMNDAFVEWALGSCKTGLCRPEVLMHFISLMTGEAQAVY